MDIHLWSDGQQQGPYPVEHILQWLSAGQIPLEIPAWTEGQGDWQPLGNLLVALGVAEAGDEDSAAEHSASVQGAAPVAAAPGASTSPAAARGAAPVRRGPAPGKRPGAPAPAAGRPTGAGAAAKRPQTVVQPAPTSAAPTGTKTVSIQGTIKRGLAADLHQRETAEVYAQPPAPEPELPPQPAPAPPRQSGKLIALIAGGVLLLAALGAGVWFFLNREAEIPLIAPRAGQKELEEAIVGYANGRRGTLPNRVQGRDILRGLELLETFQYEPTGQKTYKLTEAGPDGRFQTSDDKVHDMTLP